jgi:ketosteroid isomerase-like protein
MDPERFFDAGDRIVVYLRLSGTGRSSGIEVANNPAHVWTLRAGKAVRLEVYLEREREQALDAVGWEEEG